MESNLHLDPLCGGPYPFVRLRPDIYKQSVSCLDDFSIKEEQDKNLPMDENLPKNKTSGKTGVTNAPRMLVLNTYYILGDTFLMPTQEDSQKFRFCIVKMIDYHKTKLAKDPDHTQFVCSVNDDQYD